MIAKDLGMTVAELTPKLSMSEFNEWIAFYSIRAKERKKAQEKGRR